MELIKQDYPLTITFNQAEKLVNKIFKLVKILRKDRELTKKEYNSLNKITSSLCHPNKKD